MLGEDLIDERALFFKGLYRAAAWQLVIIQATIHSLRIQLSDCSQASSASSVHLVQLLTQNELPGVGSGTNVEPVRCRTPTGRAFPDHRPGRASIHAPDDNVNPVERLPADQVLRHRLPPEIPEQIQPVHEHDTFEISHFTTTERLPHA